MSNLGPRLELQGRIPSRNSRRGHTSHSMRKDTSLDKSRQNLLVNLPKTPLEELSKIEIAKTLQGDSHHEDISLCAGLTPSRNNLLQTEISTTSKTRADVSDYTKIMQPTPITIYKIPKEVKPVHATSKFSPKKTKLLNQDINFRTSYIGRGAKTGNTDYQKQQRKADTALMKKPDRPSARNGNH